MKKYIMALDAGTTSNRCILFDHDGKICSVAQKEFTQYFPKPGWVEHDANEIWTTQLGVALSAMNKIGATAEDIAAIGIANQRETTIVWDRDTGEPIYHAIVWQCRRTSEYCDTLKAEGYTEMIREKTGLSRWGVYKIRAALRAKQIPEMLIEEALRQIDPQFMRGKLEEQLRRKMQAIRARNGYELRGKLLRYGVGLGFDFETVGGLVDRLVDNGE